jgi:hypothetical protein
MEMCKQGSEISAVPGDDAEERCIPDEVEDLVDVRSSRSVPRGSPLQCK